MRSMATARRVTGDGATSDGVMGDGVTMMTMVMGNDDDNDGNGATGNKVDNDSNGATGDWRRRRR